MDDPGITAGKVKKQVLNLTDKGKHVKPWHMIIVMECRPLNADFDWQVSGRNFIVLCQSEIQMKILDTILLFSGR